MIDVRCLASGSTGNSYALDDGRSVLLLEAGISGKRIMQGYKELLPRVAGCLISHEHQDHAKGAAELARRGIPLYASAGTFGAIRDIQNPYTLHTIRAREAVQIYSQDGREVLWTVLPWEAQHDAAEPLGFLIQSRTTGEKVLFATDTYYIPYTFQGLNYIFLECNYSRELLQKAIEEGRTAMKQTRRLYQSHFGLHNVLDMLRANDLSQVQRIYLIHISRENGDPATFTEKVRAFTGKLVTTLPNRRNHHDTKHMD